MPVAGMIVPQERHCLMDKECRHFCERNRANQHTKQEGTDHLALALGAAARVTAPVAIVKSTEE